jgi:hypothetical protein
MIAEMQIEFRKANASDSDTLTNLVFGEATSEGRRVLAAVLGIKDPEPLWRLFRRVWSASETWPTASCC